MKIQYLREKLTRHLIRCKWQVLITILILIIGAFLGVRMATKMDAQGAEVLDGYINNFVSAYNIESIDAFGVFKFSLYSGIKASLLAWISGLWIGLLPLLAIQIGAKGYKLGFSAALLAKNFGIKGALLAAFSSIPQIVIFIPFFVFYAVFNINFAFFQHRKRTVLISARAKNEIYIKNLVYLLLMIACSFFVAFADAYVVPMILKPVCSVWGKY